MGCGASKTVAAPAAPSVTPAPADETPKPSPVAAPPVATPEDNKKFLEKVDLFKRLPQEDLPTLVKACEAVSFEPGAQIIKQGDIGNEFFVIKTGSAKVDVNGNTVATLKAGDYFGENALLRDDPRNAGIICQAKIEALKITREQFMKLGLNEKLEFAKRGAVGGAAADAEIKPPCDKSDAEKTLISDALKGNVNLNNMIMLNEAKTNAMTAVMWKEDIAANTAIIQEGDLNADYFYVVSSGNFEVSKLKEGCSAENRRRGAAVLPFAAREVLLASWRSCTSLRGRQPSQQQSPPVSL